MNEIVWEEPPRPTARKGRSNTVAQARAVADALKSRPGEWARIRTFTEDEASTEPRQRAISNAYQIRSGRVRWAEPSGAFEAVARSTASGWALYARYVGEDGAR